MEPLKVLDRLEVETFEKEDLIPAEDADCSFIFPKKPLPDSEKRLYKPCVSSTSRPDSKAAQKKQKTTNLANRCGGFKFEKEGVLQVCPNIDFPVTPTNDTLKYIGNALDIFEQCISDLTGSDPQTDQKDTSTEYNPETVFEELFKKLMDHIENITVPEIRLGDEVEYKASTLDNDITVSIPDPHPTIRQLLRALILWCTWVFQLSQHTQDAIRLARTPLKKEERHKLLHTAMGIKQSNRNMAFYSFVCTKLMSILQRADSQMDQILSTLFCKVQYIKQMLDGVPVEDNSTWNKVSSQLSTIVKDKNEIPYDDADLEFMENINLVRNEMRLRIDRKGYSDALTRECDLLNNELNALNSRRQAIASRVEQIMKQIHDLVAPARVETQIDSLKVADARKLSPLLQHFFVRLNLMLLQTPNREVLYKVIRERDHVLQLSLLVPRDLLMPSSDAAMQVFPLVFVVYVDESDTLCVREPALSAHTGSIFVANEGVTGPPRAGTPRTWPLTMDPNWGLEDFTMVSNQIPSVFCDRLRRWYNMAHLHVWNSFFMERYRRQKMETIHLLPKELHKNHVSQYSISENRWALSNSCANIRLKIEFNEGLEPCCRFYDFEQKDVLKLEKPEEFIEPFVKHIKHPEKGKVTQYLNEMHSAVLDHFGERFRIVRLGVMLETYAFIFDWISSKRL